MLVLHVLEVLLAQVVDGDAVGELVADQRAGRLRDEDLAAVAGRGDARSAHDVEAEVALLPDVRLARMDPHAHEHLLTAGPVVLVESSLGVDRRGDCVARPGEREEERVALRVDLRSAVRAERLAHEAPVVGRHPPVVLVAELLQQARRAFDVGEDERDGAAGQL